VAGSAGAGDNGFGVVGVAPEVSLYALKVLGASGSGSWSGIIAALQWSVDNGIEVTNNSYGSSGNPGLLVEQGFDNAYAAGVLNVAAAGNAGRCAGNGNTVGYPARFASVMAVTATGATDLRPCFSAHGPDAEIAAPGVSIYSTYFGGYATLSGTSMSSPHVAGAAALVIAAGAQGPDSVRQYLTSTALDLGPAGRDELYGHGLVDAAAAVNAVAGPPPADDAPPSATLTNPLDGDAVSGTVTVTAEASDDNGVTQVEFKVGNSTIGIDTVAGDGWSADWDTTAWADGPHNVSAEATDTINQSAVDTVTVTVSNPVQAQGMHVGDLDGSATNLKKNWTANATATVHDADHIPVANATVSGSWSTDGGATVSCLTDGGGQCTVSSANLRKKARDSAFTVGDVSHAVLTYEPADNHDPDGDSSGASIIVQK
jgi:subtilisin